MLLVPGFVKEMVRGVTVLLFLTIFIQANMGSIFDQFNTPEKKDKNKMLMFLRGLLKLDSGSTKAHINKRGITTPVPKTEYQQVLDSKKLPDRSDKSKMLSYLRGLKTPNSVVSVYEEPKHHAMLPLNQDTLTNQNTQNANARMTQNTQNKQSVVVANSADSSSDQANWDGATATQVTILQPLEHERDSDTCFWRGQQSHSIARQGKDAQIPEDSKNRNKEDIKQFVDFENVGENMISTWECIQTKFVKAYEKLKQKICGMLYPTPNPETVDVKKIVDQVNKNKG